VTFVRWPRSLGLFHPDLIRSIIIIIVIIKRKKRRIVGLVCYVRSIRMHRPFCRADISVDGRMNWRERVAAETVESPTNCCTGTV